MSAALVTGHDGSAQALLGFMRITLYAHHPPPRAPYRHDRCQCCRHVGTASAACSA